MATYTFTLRAAVKTLGLSDAGFQYAGGVYDVNQAPPAGVGTDGNGTIVTTDDELAARLRTVRAPDGGLLLDEAGVVSTPIADRRGAVPVFVQGDQPSSRPYLWEKTSGGVPTGAREFGASDGSSSVVGSTSQLSAWEQAAKLTVVGHSWANGGPDIGTGQRLADRLNKRTSPIAYSNLGATGKRMDEILSGQVQASWTPNSLGWVLFVDGTINDGVQYGDASGLTTTQEAFRTALSILSAKAVLANTDGGFVFGGGASTSSVPASGFADLTFSGDAVDVQLGCVTTAGTTFTITSGATTLGTFATGGFKQAFTGTKRLSGFGAGTHTIRIANTGSNAGTIPGAAIPSANPVPVVWIHSADRNISTASNTLAKQYADAAQTIAQAFPNVIVVLPDATWDQTRYVGPGFHPNELGHSYLYQRAVTAMSGKAHAQGLNQISLATQDPVYSSPVAGSSFSATFPDASGTDLSALAVNAWSRHPAWPSGNEATDNANGAMHSNASTAWYIAPFTPVDPNYSYAAQFRFLSAIAGTQEAITLRSDPTTDTCYMVRWVEGTGWKLSKKISGSLTDLAGPDTTLPLDATHTARNVVLTANGTTISATIDGTALFSVTDSSISAAGKAGIFMAGGLATNSTGVHIGAATVTD